MRAGTELCLLGEKGCGVALGYPCAACLLPRKLRAARDAVAYS